MDAIIYDVLGQLPTILLLVIIGVSLHFLGKGADVLVNEAVGLSLRWGVSKMIIGATIVSLGTTIPEMTVSVVAALKGSADLALGNAVGSVITNTALIIGMVSLLGKVPVNPKIMKRQGTVQVVSAILLVLLSIPSLSGGKVSRGLGFLFIILLIGYMVLTVFWSKDSQDESDEDLDYEEKTLSLQMISLIFGVILVIISSKILIPSVEITALRIGIPQSVVAATLVAFGTSLPELITAITAVKKGHGELAVGNVIGANILNILFVVGVSAVVSSDGLLIPDLFYKLQYPTMIFTLIAFYIFGISKDEEINKKEGLALLAIYVIYLILNYALI